MRSLRYLILLTPLLVAADAATASGGATEVAARDGANLQRPQWYEDGTKLAYEANFHDEKRIELFVGDPSQNAFRRIVPVVRGSSGITSGFNTVGNASEVAHELCWGPKAWGGRFMYSASNDIQDYDLYISGGGAISPGPGADGGCAWSPDGRWLVFTSGRTGEGDLYLIDITHMDVAARRLTNRDDSSELYVAWAPSSDKLAFVGHSNSGDNLWLIPALGDAPVQLTDWSGNQTRPAFSPDGSQIAFYANLEDTGRMDLYLVEPRVGAVPRLVTRSVVPNATGPAWTPDSKHLVVVLDDDSRFDPLAVVAAAPGATPRVLDLGTVGHGDLSVVKRGAGLQIAYVAQGRSADDVADFKRLFVSDLSL